SNFNSTARAGASVNISESEKRTVRRAGVALLVFLVVYGWVVGSRVLDEKAQAYDEALGRLASLETEVLRRQKDSKRYDQLQRRWALDVERLQSEKLVSEARLSLEKHAADSGVAVAESRESSGGSVDRARIHLQVQGETEKLFEFVHGLDSLGYPIYLHRFQLIGNEEGPGQVTATLNIGLLDYRQQKSKGGRRV
ncbi:MAG: hypothetical protein KDC38_16905, partial [Planctomycetes bacterium]|nr:hypothetical protein [Planctomycetota bacterium]